MNDLTMGLLFAGVLIGVGLRTIMPYMNKMSAEGFVWEWKYAGTAFASIIFAFTAGLELFNQISVDYVATDVGAFMALFGGMIAGIGINDGINRGMKQIKKE